MEKNIKNMDTTICKLILTSLKITNQKLEVVRKKNKEKKNNRKAKNKSYSCKILKS